MSIDRKTVVRTWADRWRNLKAWRMSLDDVELVVRARSLAIGDYSTGRAQRELWSGESRRQVIVTAGADICDALCTVLHEYAHIVRYALERDSDHGDGWRTTFAEATSEVVGFVVAPELSGKWRITDNGMTDALRVWWKSSGNEFAWKLIAARSK